MASTLTTTCCVVGGGPAGMMLGYLLARAGVDAVVLEKHADFLRDFRGDTIHPSTLELMYELGLLDEFLKLPHTEVRTLSAIVGDRSATMADFTHLPTHCGFIAFMPQWDFLDFLAEHGRRYPAMNVMLRADATDLIKEGGTVKGVKATTPDGPHRDSRQVSPSAPTAATQRSARRLISSSTTSAHRWTCCGCGSRASPRMDPIPSVG